jgi:hypothetical protein
MTNTATLYELISKTRDIKGTIKDVLEAKGADMTGVPFENYPERINEALVAEVSALLDQLNREGLSGDIQHKTDYLNVSLDGIVDAINRLDFELDSNTPVREYSGHIDTIVDEFNYIGTMVDMLNNDSKLLNKTLAEKLNYCLETIQLLYDVLITFGAEFTSRTPFRDYVEFVKTLKAVAYIRNRYIPIPPLQAEAIASKSDGTVMAANCTNKIINPMRQASLLVSTNALTVSVEIIGEGVVAGQGRYAPESAVTLLATPADGWHFVSWSDGETSETKVFEITENVNLSALFEVDPSN